MGKQKLFKSLNNYAEEIIDAYCTNKKEICIDLKMIMCKQRLLRSFKDLINLQHKSINVFALSTLFPSVEHVVLRNVNLSVFTLDNLLEYMDKTKIRKIQ